MYAYAMAALLASTKAIPKGKGKSIKARTKPNYFTKKQWNKRKARRQMARASRKRNRS